jgi:hypothetical protein
MVGERFGMPDLIRPPETLFTSKKLDSGFVITPDSDPGRNADEGYRNISF